MRWRLVAATAACTVAATLAACSSSGSNIPLDESASTTIPITSDDATEPASAPGDVVEVRISVDGAGDEISPLIRGLNGDLDAAQMRDVGITVNSWGGNPTTRFNYMIGHAWNAARDYEYRNVNYTESEADAFRAFVDLNEEAGVASRAVVPTLGWIAKDDDSAHCSFPDSNGGCQGAPEAECESPGPIADPRDTSIESTPQMVADWIDGVLGEGRDVQFLSMDNEPELWGYTHYDVHPECTTYEEVLDKYLTYARALRAVAPDAQLMGPVMCCWYDFWGGGPGAADGSTNDFLRWFLENVRAADEELGQRTLDVVDLHYYPQSDVFNDNVDPETNELRLRSTRSLWDPEYVDESWIDQPINFLPRVMSTIEEAYPGTPLFISEWNFGAEESMNGALVIADVLGLFGREGVYAATYWRSPEPGSPGYMAMKMHGNYDGAGTAFEGRTVPVELADVTSVSAFAALSESGDVLRIMLINKSPETAATLSLRLGGHDAAGSSQRWTYGSESAGAIVTDSVSTVEPFTVPASSIVVLEVPSEP